MRALFRKVVGNPPMPDQDPCSSGPVRERGERPGGNASFCCGDSEPSRVETPFHDRFVDGMVDTPAGPVPRARVTIGARDVLGRWSMRWGMGRNRYRVAPGLYAVGDPDQLSGILVTANYKMTFDALRRELTGLNVWILVLDTRGVNVWCAAGKGTFGTEEVVRRVKAAMLEEVVSHRRLILPQLGGPGVSAHQVTKGCGFQVVYGPVHARDIKAFLAAGMRATPRMRQVVFPLRERLALAPVELVGLFKPAGWLSLVLFLLAGIGPGFFSIGAAWHRGLAAAEVLAGGILGGAVLTPVLLPWLPGRAFSAKGALAGGILAVCSAALYRDALGAFQALALLLALPVISSFVAMNFTGATPFTSPSGVEKEMRQALPVQAALTALAGIFWVGGAFLR